MDLAVPSRPHQAIEQRPGKHKAAQPPKDIAYPHVAQRSVEVFPGLSLSFQGKQQPRDHERGNEVEDEARVGLQAECAGGDTEEGGSEVADVGCYLAA